MEIVLLRHGKPCVALNGWIDALTFKEIVEVYANSEICDVPAASITDRFHLHTVICSDLPRSIDSAKKLDIKSVHLTDSLYAETAIPHFDKGKLKLPVLTWLVCYRLLWLLGFKKNGESYKAAKERAKIAAENLICLAHENNNVILVGHGLMNRLIAKQLLEKNWSGPRSPGSRHWAYGVYKPR